MLQIREFLLATSICAVIYVTSGDISLWVDPYPAIIHQNAPAQTPVLTIHGEVRETTEILTRIGLTPGSGSEYFDIRPQSPKIWVLFTNKTIDKAVNDTFKFRVYGIFKNSIRDRQIEIVVTKRNIHPPIFIQTHYNFFAHRYALTNGLVNVGVVKATDRDDEEYNSLFEYYMVDEDDSFAKEYFVVANKSGKITVLQDFSPNLKTISFSVMALDHGSPQLTGQANVTVSVTDVLPPDVFCVFVDARKTRICWKDATNGHYVQMYELLIAIDGRNISSSQVPILGSQEEICTSVYGTRIQETYNFTVRVYNGTQWSPDSIKHSVVVAKEGLYGNNCSVFTNCSIREPCKNNGMCHANLDLSFWCQCVPGWGGENCTDIDLCVGNPCINNGTCVFISDHQFRCECSDNFYGNHCEYRDLCESAPCLNNGTCLKKNDGTFQCICADNYIGDNCEIRNPCVPSPCHIGECIEIDDLTPKCVCTEGYYGILCEEQDPCILNNPCRSGGVCHLKRNNETYCLCLKGFKGKFCDIVDPCDLSIDVCDNGANCVFHGHNNFTCSCPPGYWGNECQNYNPCVEKRCINGKCVNTSNANYRCECDQGYFGQTCERFDTCFNTSCYFGGSCLNISDFEYLCQCINGRYGRNCEKLDGCKVKYCEHNATCVNISSSGDIECICTDEYYGELCEYYDPCSRSPCLNDATCTISLSSTYSCKCTDDFYGDKCDIPNPCYSTPCMNGGSCRNLPNNSFLCTCAGSFFGDYCTEFDFCDDPGVCQNGGTCSLLHSNPLMSEDNYLQNSETFGGHVTDKYICICPDGYGGHRCNEMLMCSSTLCGGGGTCIVRESDSYCLCPDGKERTNCSNDYCPATTTFSAETGRYDWPDTNVGDEAKIYCHFGPVNNSLSYAVRECSKLPNGTSDWLPANTSACLEVTTADASNRLRDLMTMTGYASHLGPDEVANITNTLEDVFSFSLEDENIAKSMVSVVGNLLEVNESVLIESNFKNNSSSRLLWLLEEYSANAVVNGSTAISTENIHLMVLDYESNGFGSEVIYQPSFSYPGATESDDIVFTLPYSVLPTTNEDPLRLQFMLLRSSAFFIPVNESPPPEDIVLNQRVLTASVKGKQLTDLVMPVSYRIANILPNDNHSCVYWNTKAGKWSNFGMVTKATGGNYTECLSYHLTSFAVLLDPTPTFTLSVKHEKILTFISYIGSAISMAGLLFTILTYALFKCLNRDKSGRILLNLCVAMLLLNMVFVVGSEISESSEQMCMTVSILLHYFLLATLMWMCMEAINMYQVLVTVFTKYSGYFMLKRCLAAWGIPVFVIAITAGVNLDHYRPISKFCFISHANLLAYYISVVGPACLILLVNTVVFIMVARVILKPRFKGQVGSSDKVSPAQIRGAFAVMILLGVTWVFGPFAVNEAKLAFNYIFCVLNSLQGFLIFIFRCLFNPEARMAWVLLIKSGQIKRRKGPVKSTSDTSKANTKLNGSFVDTNTAKTNTSSSVD